MTKPAVAASVKKIEKLVRNFDDDFIKWIAEEDLLEDRERKKILIK